jgi:Fur family ferric uptake transcriptional regulator
MMSRIERLCVEKGLKMTGQRRVIAGVLSDAADHPDVEELYRRAVALDNRMSIATVYRTVRLFEENGILERRDFGGGRARYEPTTPGPHHHLVDVDTGRVIEFIDPEPAGIRSRLAPAGAVRPPPAGADDGAGRQDQRAQSRAEWARWRGPHPP